MASAPSPTVDLTAHPQVQSDDASAAPTTTTTTTRTALDDDAASDEDDTASLPVRAAGRRAKRRRILDDEDEADEADEESQAEGHTNSQTHSSIDHAESVAAELPRPSAASSSPLEKTVSKRSRSKATSSVQARSVAPLDECATEVSAFARMLESERGGRTGWIPSLSRLPAAALDARELLNAAMARRDGVDNEIARRRQTQDSFLTNLAAKYARPPKTKAMGAKKGKKKTKDGDGVEDADHAEATPQPKPKKRKATAAADEEKEFVIDDMTFLMTQERLGWDKKIKPRHR